MLYNVYVKGVSEDTYAAAGYAVYANSSKLRESRKELVQTPKSKQSPLYMELYALYLALYTLEEGSSVLVHSQNRAVCAWLKNVRIGPPEKEPYVRIWRKIIQILYKRQLGIIGSEWDKVGECNEADELRKYTFR